MRTRVSEAIWIESKSYWQVKVQKDGIRKAFTSSVKGRKGKHLAEAKADKWLEEGTSDMRLSKAFEIFLQTKINPTQGKKTPCYLTHESNSRVHILPLLGSKKLSNITPALWQQCLDTAASSGLSEKTVYNIRGTIMVFYHYARRARLHIPTIEKGDLIIPKYAKKKKNIRILSTDCIRLLFEHPELEYYGKTKLGSYPYAFQFMVVTGLRRGETVGLQFADINSNMLTVNRAVNKSLLITNGKNENANRTIELSPIAMSIIEKQKALMKERRIVSKWVFPDQYGEMSNPRRMSTEWCNWCKYNNISCTIHGLRHTFISMNKNDMPEQLMKAVVGHSSQMDTFGVYGHETENDKHRAAQIIDNVFGSIINDKKSGGKVGG